MSVFLCYNGIMEKFQKDDNIMHGKGESDDVTWVTVNGAHIPIKDGQNVKQAIDSHFKKDNKLYDKELTNGKNGDKVGKYKEKGTITKIKTFEGKEEGTYNYTTGERVNLSDGYMVTFHQNEPDEKGHYKSHYGRYSEEEYDDMANQFANDNNAEMFVGVFDNEPEISFKVKTVEQAMKLAIRYNQKSIWKNDNCVIIPNDFYDKTKNPMRGD